jgi:hypothetical protein
MPQVSEFPDVYVAVLNKNDHPIAFYPGFDGADYVFAPKQAVPISAEAAYFIFGFDTRGGKSDREAPIQPGRGGPEEQHKNGNHVWQRAVANGWTGHEALRAFLNFDFKVVRKPRSLSPEDFARLK